MSLNVNVNIGTVTAAINAFKNEYHDDYWNVRSLARRYLQAPPADEIVSSLAGALRTTLASWGTDRRVAPACQSVARLCEALRDVALHEKLVALEESSRYLAITDAGMRGLHDGSPFDSVDDFDHCLIDTLHSLSALFLIGNTNVTYPTKLLLLLTGLMPALDSQVKGGLKVAGASGVKKTQYLLPQPGSTDARKICALPFYISDCAAAFNQFLDTETRASNHPELAGDYGRIFDVVFFEQNKYPPGSAIFYFTDPPQGNSWYAI